MAGRMKKFSENSSTIQEVMDSIARWILTQILSFRDFFLFFFWGGGASTFGWVLVSLGQSLACVKISGRSTP